VTAIVWQDKCTVQLLSTNSDPLNDGGVKHKTGKGNEEAEIPCPQAIMNYTKYMGGVDISDQKREYYILGQSSNVNSFILYDLNNRSPLTAQGNRQLTFRCNLHSASADRELHFARTYRQEKKSAHRHCIT
jgi:glycerol kinase